MGLLQKVKESESPKDITVEWKTEEETLEVPFRLKPINFGESMLLAKKADREGKDKYDLQYELLTKIVRKKTDDGDWARLTQKELKELPQGFVVKLTVKVNDFLGLEETENFTERFPETRMRSQ